MRRLKDLTDNWILANDKALRQSSRRIFQKTVYLMLS